MRAPLRPRDLMAIVVVSAFALAASGTHVVGSGETLSEIAADHGTSVRALVEANGLSNPNLIVVGKELTIPAGGSSGSSSSAKSTTYVVEKGDTLARIASKFGTTVSAVVAANGLADPNHIVVGRSLTISGSSGSATASVSNATPASTGSGKQLRGQRHTVKSGDTIYGIARRYGLDQADFVRWNGLVDGKLYATTRLLLFNPGNLPGSKSSTAAQTHTVSNGQTLSAIANRYGTTSSAIAKASGLSDVNSIRAGQKLTVPGSSGGGAFRCPVPGGSYFNDWAFPRSGGRSHAGTDIFAARGAPVYAPASGWVDIATGTIGGHQFRLKSADGTLWFGSHMDSFGKRGQVSAGDVIGHVGDSGNAKGGRPHLHFEIHPGDQAVNPFPLLRSVC